MKKIAFFIVLIAATIVFMPRADAIQFTLGTKNTTVTFTVTPSPTPVGYVPATSPGITSATRIGLLDARSFDSMVAYDPVVANDMVAVAPTQGPVKVDFTVKIDPTYQYFHIVPKTPAMNAGYGANTFTCAFQVFAHYTTAFTVYDYTYGSNTSGGTPGFNGYPTYNYPTTSALSWLAQGYTTSYAAFSNNGSLQKVFAGAAGASITACINLSLTVPASIPAGTYSATLSYTMTHS